MKLHNKEFEDFEEMSLEQLHKKAYESIDREEYPFNDDSNKSSESEEFTIEQYIQNPYDYGSEEYLSAMEKIKANREAYRKKVLEKQIIKRMMGNQR